MRFALGVEYDGREFSGWESQRGGERTVQDRVEEALSRVADRPVRTVCAGRTDAGVHAWGQVVHFDTDAIRDERAWVYGTNANLPADASVVWARKVAPDFHARFSARSRHYRYVIFNRGVRPAVEQGRVTWEYRPLDEARMRSAACYLLGEHDFSSFRAQSCQARSPVRTVQRIEVTRRGLLVCIDVAANAFLHHMVRNMAGVLMAVGMGKREPHWVEEVLAARDRTRAGITAAPHGLYLTRVVYPPESGLPDLPPTPTL